MIALLVGFLWTVSLLQAQEFGVDDRYAAHSVLSEGRWVKIRIPETGLYQISDEMAREAGFADAAHVSVWGYGGALQPEVLQPEYLKATDDLKPVPTFDAEGRRLFYAIGPVNWSATGKSARVQNYYSNYGYYFLTDVQTDEQSMTDSTAFVSTFYPSPTHTHSLYEVDNYAWYHGGRQLFDHQLFGQDVSHSYELPAYSDKGSLTISMVFRNKFTAEVFLNDSLLATITPSTSVVSSITGNLMDSYGKAGQDVWHIPVDEGLQSMNTITIKQLSGKSLRLDYLAINSTEPRPAWSLSDTTLPVPEIVGEVAHQDRHADAQADMVIIIPASRKLQEQAERLKKLHEERDGLRVNLVPADELYNEFSSGTPDGNAYRRYLKMLYDRAETESDRPRYLLLFGDGAWDNRMLLTDWSSSSPDNYLLCYESLNSYSETKCYVTDDYFGYLDDGDGKNMLKSDLIDVAVGRFPVTKPEEAKIMVDKLETYYDNPAPGAWQNLLCFMGDDGNKNMHMNDAEVVVAEVESNYKGYQIEKIYWDAYKRSTSISGDRFPDVERLVKQRMQDGALIMNYTGHGGARALSHEYVVTLTDFETTVTNRLPFWVTASCDIMPFDRNEKTIGETAVLAPEGGAIAFFGTARTVYAFYNQYMNKHFMRHVLGSTNGRRNSIGEAARLAKNELTQSGDDRTENKFQYVLLGDPALVLAAPTLQAVVDSINGKATGGELIKLGAGSRVTVCGSIPEKEDFNGTLSVQVFDAEQTVTGMRNNKFEADTAIVFKDFSNPVYTGTHRVTNGRFKFAFTVSRDISYSDIPGKIIVYAITDDKQFSAHGDNRDYFLGSSDDEEVDEEGPTLVCYLNDVSFGDGDEVEQQALFVAEIYDKGGINTSGSGIGHDLELVIDNKIAYTYNLNNYFESTDELNRQGVVRYQLPVLSYGQHKLRFRAWDMLNNSSKVTFEFCVVDPLGIESVSSDVDHSVGDVFDTLGRKVSGPVRSGNRLYIWRMPDGSVKKMMRPRQ